MLKPIFSIAIIATFGTAVFAMVLPVQASQLAQQVLGQTVTLPDLTSISSPGDTIASLVSSIVPKSVSSSDVVDNSPLSASNIIDATNNERIKAGLQPLKTNSKLEETAEMKTEDMVANHYFAHSSLEGKTVADLGTEIGYNYVVMGENLAVGDFTNAQDLLTAWMNSPGHRANILNPSYQDIGVYAEQGVYQGHSVWFAVQHFGTERGVCPSINTVLKSNIDTLNASIVAQETTITALRAKIENANHPTGQTYSDMISHFNTLVKKYNADLATSQSEISSYNKEVVSFNNCLSQYQSSASVDSQ